MRASDLGLLASLGIGEVSVRRRLRVAFFSTGDELRSLGEPLDPGSRVRQQPLHAVCDAAAAERRYARPRRGARRTRRARSRIAQRRRERGRGVDLGRRLGRRSGFHQTTAANFRRRRVLEHGHAPRPPARVWPHLVRRAAGRRTACAILRLARQSGRRDGDVLSDRARSIAADVRRDAATAAGDPRNKPSGDPQTRRPHRVPARRRRTGRARRNGTSRQPARKARAC